MRIPVNSDTLLGTGGILVLWIHFSSSSPQDFPLDDFRVRGGQFPRPLE